MYYLHQSACTFRADACFYNCPPFSDRVQIKTPTC